MTRPFDLGIVGGIVVIPKLGEIALNIGIRGERIAVLLSPDEPMVAEETIDARGLLVMPGAIDPHVHIGYTGYGGMPEDALLEQFESESRSALVGGVTSMVVTYRSGTTYDELAKSLIEGAQRRSRIDFAYSFGITNQAHLERIGEYYRRFGVTSFKFYMAYRGEEAQATGNTYNQYDDGLLYEGMRSIAAIPGGIAMVHAENVEIINRLRHRLREKGRSDLAAWSDSRPAFVEAENIRRALYLAEHAGCAVYIPHLSSSLGLDACLQHRDRRTTPVFIETCPHYLTHTKDAGCGILAKVNPPVREPTDRERLWGACADGAIETIGTDHCAIGVDTKGSDVWQAVPGFPGMATMVAVLLDGMSRGLISSGRVAELVSYNTARIFGLYPRKGSIAIGGDADLMLVDPNLRRTVEAGRLGSRSDFSIYQGEALTGWPVLTIRRGSIAMRDEEVLAGVGTGRYLSRNANQPVEWSAL